MKQIILVLEGRSSTETDYKYIKSALDYYYDTRTFSIKHINSTSKSKLIDQNERINSYINRYDGESIVIIVADYDYEDDLLNKRIIDYCKKKKYDLVWMNRNVEEVFLGKIIKPRDKGKEVLNFLKNKDKIICKLNNLNNSEVINNKQSSNLLFILDKYIKRK